MADINIKVDVPEGLREKFERALDKMLEQFERRIKFSMVDEIVANSELTDRQIRELSKKVKEKAAKKHEL